MFSGVRDQMVGKPVEALIAALRATPPDVEVVWPGQCNPHDR
jgi:hypothetical protein